jgi:hypothetical protein
MLKTVHSHTGSAWGNVRRVSTKLRHEEALVNSDQRRREFAASGCFLAASANPASLTIFMSANAPLDSAYYHYGNMSQRLTSEEIAGLAR